MWQGCRDSYPGEAARRRAVVGTMAHRRGRIGRKISLVGAGVATVFGLLAGSVLVANRVAQLRTGIARLEDRREVLEVEIASRMLAWNKATSPAEITERARTELGLVAPVDPGLVLVQLPSEGQRTSPWRRFVDSVAGGEAVAAADAAPVLGTMISLRPRSVRAAEANR